MITAKSKEKTFNKGNDELSGLKNVGPAMRRNLHVLGIETVEQLAHQDADQLFAQLRSHAKDRVDPCVHDVFSATIHQAQTGEALPWWEFSSARKSRHKTANE